jgi:hypothetical protein
LSPQQAERFEPSAGLRALHALRCGQQRASSEIKRLKKKGTARRAARWVLERWNRRDVRPGK